jgi:excinuclease ABC subunit C
MVSHIVNIEFTIVENEYEALLLENSLIKKHQPKYNVNLKDGKTYPFIAIKSEPFPRIISTRYVVKDGSEYYGPFVSGYNKNLTLGNVAEVV